MNPLTTIQTYIAGAVAALCIALGAAGAWYAPWIGARAQVHRADARTADVSQKLALANTSLGTCKGNEANLGKSLDEQSAAVKAMGEESARKSAAATEAAQRLRTATNGLRQRAVAVMAEKPVGDACKAADALILGSLGR